MNEFVIPVRRAPYWNRKEDAPWLGGNLLLLPDTDLR